MLEGGHAAVQTDEDVVAASKVRELENRVRDLERTGTKDHGKRDPQGSYRDRSPKKTQLALGVLYDAEDR